MRLIHTLLIDEGVDYEDLHIPCLLSGLLLRTLVVGRRQQSKSIEAARDIIHIYGVRRFGLNRFDIGRCHCL